MAGRGRRAPHGARGLKLLQIVLVWCVLLSRPARGAWIEMLKKAGRSTQYPRRAPHGARGLKFYPDSTTYEIESRAPHGARGLKFRDQLRRSGLFLLISGRAPHGARGLKSLYGGFV